MYKHWYLNAHTRDTEPTCRRYRGSFSVPGHRGWSAFSTAAGRPCSSFAESAADDDGKLHKNVYLERIVCAAINSSLIKDIANKRSMSRCG